MALSDKNLVITPNISNTAEPKIVFSGANSSVGAQNITVTVYPTNNGTLSFEGSAGQLFSITNDLSNTLFTVADISGIPSFEAYANGQVNMARFGGNVQIGATTSTTTVSGNVIISKTLTANGGVGTAGQVLTSGASGNVYWSTVSGGGSLPTTIAFQNTTGTATASGANSIALGAGSNTTTYAAAIAIGANATVAMDNSIAIGYDLKASGNGVAIGHSMLNVNNYETVAIGYNINAGGGAQSTLIGARAFGSSGYETGVGTYVNLAGTGSAAFGYGAASKQNYSVALGSNSLANGTNSVVVGYNANNISGNSAIVIGTAAVVTANQSIAIGNGASVSANNSVAIGTGVSVTTANTIQLGQSGQTVVLPGTITANSGVGTAGQVLTSGASGNVYWSTVAGGGASVTISDTAPVSPSAGNLWWDSGNAILRIYYNDGTSSQWVDAVPAVGGSGGSASITVSDTAPVAPSSGSLWWDSTVGVLRLYYADGTSNQWVDAVPQGGGGSGGSSMYTYIVDDISTYFDNVTTTFNLTSNGAALTPDSPYRLDVNVGGIPLQPSVGIVDYLNAPENITYTPGYAISGSTISFVSAPRSGMSFFAKMTNGDTMSPTFVATKNVVNFNALNIMSGY